METNLELVINGKPIKSLVDLIALDLSEEEKLSYSIKLLDLFNYLTPPNVLSNELTIELENQLLKRKVSALLSKTALMEMQLSMFNKSYDYALKDITKNPPAREINGTYEARRLTFYVEIQNIIAILSDERLKKIYLKEPIQAKDGGIFHKIIYANDNKVNFNVLLAQIQKSSIHLIKVNRSIAVNIYKYNFKDEKYFTLIEEQPSHLPDRLVKIKIDKTFNSQEYFSRLYDLKRLYSSLKSYEIHFRKMEEIDHYIKSKHIT